jgi:hypothetical protein
MEEGGAMEEHRTTSRQRVLLAAKVMLNGGGVIDCTVRDRSPAGARLKVVSVVGIPDRFDLLIGAEERPQIAEIVWRKQGEVGVRFA